MTWLEVLSGALGAFGTSFGASAGGGGAQNAHSGLHREAAQAAGRENDSRFSRQQTAEVEALYAQAQANANSTSSIVVTSGALPHWWRQAPEPVHEYVVGERMVELNAAALRRRMDRDTRSCSCASHREPASVKDGYSPGPDYGPIELEQHDDFAEKLAARPKEQSDGTT